MTTALIIVDLQNDFMPGGALAVPDGDAVVPIANRLMPRYEIVAATQDWHPADHASFAANHPGHELFDTVDLDGLEQILWPAHCVQGSRGAEFHPDLDTTRCTAVFTKGADPRIDSYSGFFDNGKRQATGLGDWLRDRGVGSVDILGLATDYCVKFTALDAIGLGFETRLLVPACRGVGLNPGDIDRALKELQQAGVILVDRIETEVP